MIATAIIGALGPVANLIGGIVTNKKQKADPDPDFQFFPDPEPEPDRSGIYIMLAVIAAILLIFIIRKS